MLPHRGNFLLRLLPVLWTAGMGCAADAPLPLWPDNPPDFATESAAETRDAGGNIANVSVPTITVFLPPKEKSNGTALVVCPGGSYRMLGWAAHVTATADYFLPKGTAVIGLKYRTSPPHQISPSDRRIPLRDLQRAIRVVRSHAAEWNIDPQKIGVLGFSAGANLALTLAGEFDHGDTASDDPIQRFESRPDFVVACSAWHWRQKTSPFVFSENTPPVFLVHAADDAIAPIDLPIAVKAQLEAARVPVKLEVFPDGGHSVGHLVPRRIAQNVPSSKWPERLRDWLGGIDPRFKDATPGP